MKIQEKKQNGRFMYGVIYKLLKIDKYLFDNSLKVFNVNKCVSYLN